MSRISTRTTALGPTALAFLAIAPSVWASEGTVALNLQRRDPKTGAVAVATEKIVASKTGIVVIDMWDRHWCKTYTARVGNLVPRMNRTLAAARKLGIRIVHAPSDVVDFYKDYPQRKAMQAIPAQPVPRKVVFDPPAEPAGKDCCECGPAQPCKTTSFGRWRRQHPDLKIADGDLIADCNNARELLNLCRARGLNTLIYMGVASNMCVLHRQCGMLNMRRHGLAVIFVSDLVQAITANGLDPATKTPDWNFTPAKGSAEIQRYLERHVAPSFESRQLITAAGMDPRADDKRPHVVFVTAEQEYKSADTLRAFAKRHLERNLRCTFLRAKADRRPGRNDVPGLDALYDADLLVLSMRRRALPVVQMDHLERYIRTGKPLVAIRVSVVPFQLSDPKDRPDGHVVWQDFDTEVLGCDYRGYDAGSRKTGCDVRAVPEAKGQSILRGLEGARFHSPSWLYRTKPLAATTTLLMVGRWSQDRPEEPVAWTHTYNGGRVFYTSLGHWEDFKMEPFQRLLLNGIHWALGPSTGDLIAGISNEDDEARTAAWLGAAEIGAPAVKPLASLMSDERLEVGRAAKNGLWRIVRHAGRPGADRDKKAVIAELVSLLGEKAPASVLREVLWMLSEIGGDESVTPIAALLSDAELREDARMALERIPGPKSLDALKAGLKTAPTDFKRNIAQSLRKRGVHVAGIPCRKLVPTKKTTVKPAGPK